MMESTRVLGQKWASSIKIECYEKCYMMEELDAAHALVELRYNASISLSVPIADSVNAGDISLNNDIIESTIQWGGRKRRSRSCWKPECVNVKNGLLGSAGLDVPSLDYNVKEVVEEGISAGNDNDADVDDHQMSIPYDSSKDSLGPDSRAESPSTPLPPLKDPPNYVKALVKLENVQPAYNVGPNLDEQKPPCTVKDSFQDKGQGKLSKGEKSIEQQVMEMRLPTSLPNELRFTSSSNDGLTHHKSARRRGGKSKIPTSEAEKEARRVKRIQANRESARQTIRRKQVICEDLSRKANELELLNQGIKEVSYLEIDQIKKDCVSLKESSFYLKQQLVKGLDPKIAHRVHHSASATPFIPPLSWALPLAQATAGRQEGTEATDPAGMATGFESGVAFKIWLNGGGQMQVLPCNYGQLHGRTNIVKLEQDQSTHILSQIDNNHTAGEAIFSSCLPPLKHSKLKVEDKECHVDAGARVPSPVKAEPNRACFSPPSSSPLCHETVNSFISRKGCENHMALHPYRTYRKDVMVVAAAAEARRRRMEVKRNKNLHRQRLSAP